MCTQVNGPKCLRPWEWGARLGSAADDSSLRLLPYRAGCAGRALHRKPASLIWGYEEKALCFQVIAGVSNRVHVANQIPAFLSLCLCLSFLVARSSFQDSALWDMAGGKRQEQDVSIAAITKRVELMVGPQSRIF